MLNNNSPSIIDCHCHLDFTDFDNDRTLVLQRATSASISHIIIPGTEKKYWSRITQLCDSHQQCLPCYGLHPYWANTHAKTDIQNLEDYLTNYPALGVGECGLDFRPQQADKQLQLLFFDAQLAMAQQFNLPAIIHSVKATEIVIRQIKAAQKKPSPLRGMVHSYSGSLEQAKQLIDLGFFISIGGSATNANNKKIRQVIKNLPLSALLLETDAPDQTPTQHISSQRNEPAFITSTIQSIADLKDISITEVCEQTTKNAQLLFSIPA